MLIELRIIYVSLIKSYVPLDIYFFSNEVVDFLLIVDLIPYQNPLSRL